MGNLNLTFYKGTDIYSDGDIENEILTMTQEIDYIKNLRTSTDWAVLYHLTPERRNLLEWYDFKKNDEVLEIGAGCGALTEFFCEKVKSVTSIELSKRRAEIISNRTKQYENLEIIVGNLNDIKINKQYDYITLIGVLEYAKSFTEGNSPYETFLKNIKQYLKPNGTLIIAIENKFGLKYWAGAREDHTGRFFDSIENYPNNSNVRTFGKYELSKLLNNVGFANLEFYYPYPDYKIPTQILTDRTQDIFCNYNENSPNYDTSRYVFFNEKLAMKNLIQNNIYGEFANSFLVFAKNNPSDTKLVYSRLRRELKSKYQIATDIILENDNYKVIKKPLSVEAIEHIHKIQNNSNKLKKQLDNSKIFDVTNCIYDNDGLHFEYVDGNDLLSELSIVNDSNNINKIYEFIDYYISLLNQIYPNYETIDFKTENIEEFYGVNKVLCNVKCIKNPNIDLTLTNIIKKGSKYYIIDYEWVLDGYIPFNYIVFRGLFIQRYKDVLFKQISQDELLSYLNITPEEFNIYMEMEQAFIQKIINPNMNASIKQQYLKKQNYYSDIVSEKDDLAQQLSKTNTALQQTISEKNDLAQQLSKTNTALQQTIS